MLRATLKAAALAALLLAPTSAPAKLCGDDVGGLDVPCGCGDTVVSDLVVGNDPVAHAVCARNGLVVRAAGTGRAVTIDLRGATLQGAGKGAGIRVDRGGAGGAQVVSTGATATIAGFRDGVVGRAGEVALLAQVRVEHCRRDGVRLGGLGYAVQQVEVEQAGRDGFALQGSAFQLRATRSAHSGRFGYFVQGQDAVLGTAGAGLWAEASTMSGFHILGKGHRLEQCVAVGGSGHGFRFHGARFTVVGSEASGNAGDGFTGLVGMGWFGDNRALGNGGNGLWVRGPAMADGGGNHGAQNRGQGQRRPAVQCELGGQPCTP